MDRRDLRIRLVSPLREGRIYYGITQLEMAKKLGRETSAYISLIESGERRLDVEAYVLWREALGMSLNFLHSPPVFSDHRDPFRNIKK